MSTHTPEDPPPDGGPLLFASSFLAVPSVLLIALSSGTHRHDTLRSLAMPLGLLVLGGIWVYFARTRAGVVVKAALIGALVFGVWAIWGLGADLHVSGDDTLPLLMIFLAPAAVVGGLIIGMIAGGLVLGAFAFKQHARTVWLSEVVAGRNARYSIVTLLPPQPGKPAFLRYLDGELGLLSRASAEYRDPPVEEIVARVNLRPPS